MIRLHLLTNPVLDHQDSVVMTTMVRLSLWLPSRSTPGYSWIAAQHQSLRLGHACKGINKQPTQRLVKSLSKSLLRLL